VKESLSPGQTRAIAMGGGLLVVAGLVAWLGLRALGERQAEAQALAERMGNPALASLLADPTGVARANRESEEMQNLEQQLREKDGAVLEAWSEGTREAGGEGQDWAKDPGKWKDRLIEVQSRLQKESSTRRVALAPDFYLGLEAYRQKSPMAEQVPGLAVHLSVAERLVERLMDARLAPEQYPTVCEFRTLSGPGSEEEESPRGVAAASPPGRPGATPAPPLERRVFQVEIRCSPEVLYEYVRLLTRDPWLLIMKDLVVVNEQQAFPMRSEIAKKFAQPETGEAAAGEEADKALLAILAGQESLTARLKVDFVGWKNPQEGKAAVPAARAQ